MCYHGNKCSVSDVKSVEPAEEFHDAHAPEREVVAITSDGHVDNLSKAATGSRIPAPARSNSIPTKLPVCTFTTHYTTLSRRC